MVNIDAACVSVLQMYSKLSRILESLKEYTHINNWEVQVYGNTGPNSGCHVCIHVGVRNKTAQNPRHKNITDAVYSIVTLYSTD